MPSGHRIYLDNNATSPLDPEVLDAMAPFQRTHHGNASSVHRQGQRCRAAIEMARSTVADFLGRNPKELVFTPSATAANNLAILGTTRSRRRRHDKRGVVCTRVEHPSVLESVRYLEAEGEPVTWIDVDDEGRLDTEAFLGALHEDLAMASVMLANNETGVIHPLESVVERCNHLGVPLHVDAVQGASTRDLTADLVGVDLISISAHKIGGPKGIGALVAPRRLKLQPLILGGHQERGLCAGTESPASIVGFGRATELIAERRSTYTSRVTALRDKLQQGILSGVPGARVNGGEAPRLGTTTNMSFDDTEGETVLVGLDLHGISCSSGSACTAGSLDPSHVLLAMGIARDRARAAVRFSLGPDTTEAEVDKVVHVLPTLISAIRELGPNRSEAV